MAKVKSPAEFVASTARLVGGYQFPDYTDIKLALAANTMGQQVLDPPSVEGWHTGTEWINSGSLMRRTNFFADLVGDVERPGVQLIIDRLKERGDLSHEEFVDSCLNLMGPLEIDPATRAELVSHAGEDGTLRWGETQESDASRRRIGEMLQLIVSLREYQLA